MTDLRLAVKLTLDRAGFAPAAQESARAVQGIGTAARGVATDARAMGASVVEATRSITTVAEAQSRAVATIADAVTRAKATVTRDALGTPIARSVAEATAETSRLGVALDALRARWDPLAAATARYNGLLAELQAAHAAGAISGALLVQRQAELKAAFDRTTASMADQGRAAKLAVERSIAGQTITPDRGADIAAYGAELDAIRAKYNPLWAAGQQYRTTVEEIARAERVGAITASEASAARARARAETKASVEALRSAKGATDAHAGSMKLSAFAAQNLSYQMHDVVVSLAAGMNPLTVLLQQGSQITPIFGGIGGTLTAIANLVTPARLGIALFATGGLVAARSIADFSSRTREADVAARGLGRGAGTSAGEIEVLARRYAAAGDVSIDRARSMATEFTRTGQIGSEQFGRLISIGKDFSATIGADVDTGTKQLADIFADPARGAETLANSFHLIDQSAARAVRRIAETGDTSKAQSALLDALDGRLVKYGQTIAWYQKLWEGISDPKTAGGGLGAALSEQVPQERLASLRAQYLDVQRALAKGETVGPLGMDAGPWLAKAESEMEALQRLIDRAERITAGNAATARVDRAGTIAVGVADRSPANDEAVRRIALERELANLRKGEAAPGNTAAERERIARAIDAGSRALATWISESERARQLAEIDIAMAAARDPIERAALEQRRVAIQLAGREVTATEATTAANLAYTQSIGLVVASTTRSIADISAETSARQRVNALVAAGVLTTADATRELQIEAKTRELVAAAARAEGAEKERLLGLAADLRTAMEAEAAAERRSAALQDVRSGADRLQTLRTQIALVGQSEAVQARVLALLEAEQKIRAQGYTGVEAEQLRAQARATADLTTSLDRQKAAWEEIKSTGGGAIDTLVEGLRTGKDVGASVVEDLSKELLKLSVSNPLKNAIFGQNLPTIADAGGLLGNLFGGGAAKAGIATPVASAVGTATITAGTVIVNGGVGGIAAAAAGSAGLTAVNSNGGVSDAYVRRLIQVESGGNPNDKTGSNYGLAQFSFADMKQFGLTNPLDPAQAVRATVLEAQRNAGPLAGILGRAASPGEMYLAHQQGLAGASSLLKNPNLPAWQAIRPWYGSDEMAQKAITGNAGSLDQTSKQFSDMWVKRFETGMDGASRSLTGLTDTSTTAVDALGQFGTGTTQAAQALTQSGGGIAAAGQTMTTSVTTTAATTESAFGQLTSGLTRGISTLLSALSSSLGGNFSWLGSLFGGGGGGATPSYGGLYDTGGYTGSIGRTSIAGLVHGEEYVINAAATAKHRPLLEAINAGFTMSGYATGGYVGDAPRLAIAPARSTDAGPSTAPVFQTVINNNSAAQVSTREEDDGRGGRRQVVTIEEAVGRAIGRPRSAAQRALDTAYGLQTRVIRR